MVSREEQRARVEVALAAHLLDHGLAQTSLRELARAAAVSDRMLLYYFTDKAEVLGCAAQRIAADLAGQIGEAVGEGERLAPLALLERAGALVTRAEIRPYMRLWVQMIAAAGRREAPFPAIAEAMLAGFLAWVETHLAIDEAADRQAVAAMIVAAACASVRKRCPADAPLPSSSSSPWRIVFSATTRWMPGSKPL